MYKRSKVAAGKRTAYRRALVRQELLKLQPGNVEDEDHFNRALKRAFTFGEPLAVTEPYYKFPLFNWRLNNMSSDAPTPSADGKELEIAPVVAVSDLQSLDQFKIREGVDWADRTLAEAPFIATRYGLCRFMYSPVAVTGGGTTHVQHLMPVGASSMARGNWTVRPVQIGLGSAGEVVTGMSTVVEVHPGFFRTGWIFQGSGMLPVNGMWQPLPWYRPEPRFVRAKHMYGRDVLLKYRTLEMKVEEFPFTERVGDVLGHNSFTWAGNAGVVGDYPCHLVAMDKRRFQRFTVLFVRKVPKPMNEGFYDPVHVPLRAPVLRGDKRFTYAVGWERLMGSEVVDTPQHVNIHRMVPDPRAGTIITARTYVIKRPAMLQRGSEPALSVKPTLAETLQDASMARDAAEAGHGRHFVHPTGPAIGSPATFSSTLGRLTGTGTTMAQFDADGMPIVPYRIIRWKRKLHGRKLLYRDWDMPPRYDGRAPVEHYLRGDCTPAGFSTQGYSGVNTVVYSVNTELRQDCYPMGGEVFVTVLTNATLCKAPIPVLTNGFLQHAWRLDPRNMDAPVAVHIRNRIWYGDVAPGAPQDTEITTSIDTGDQILAADNTTVGQGL